MKVRTNVIFISLALFLVFVGPHCHAQKAPVADPDATRLRQVGRTAAFYHKKADFIEGSVFFYALGTIDDIDKEKDVITMTFLFKLPGKTLMKPETISVEMTTKSLVSKYTTDHKLRLFADNKLVVDAEMELTLPRREGSVYGTERFRLNAIKFKVLEKLAKAKKVVVQFGETKFTLGAEQQKGIQDFYQLFQD